MKYEGGLREEILAFVASSEVRNYVELVNKRRVMKDYTKRLASKRSDKKEVGITKDTTLVATIEEALLR